jgi:hypothetical protein
MQEPALFLMILKPGEAECHASLQLEQARKATAGTLVLAAKTEPVPAVILVKCNELEGGKRAA